MLRTFSIGLVLACYITGVSASQIGKANLTLAQAAATYVER